MTTRSGLTDGDLTEIDAALAAADADRVAAYPGDRSDRQPVHTVYIPAHRFDAGTVGRWGREALAALDADAPTAAQLAAAAALDPAAVAAVWDGVRGKLGREPIEDLRVDLEDGYGTRPDDEEDQHAVAAGQALGELIGSGEAPPFLGIRFKSRRTTPANPVLW